MARKLKVWNGRPYGVLPKSKWTRGHDAATVYACARSVNDLRDLCLSLGLIAPSAGEVRDYWSPCWGNSMDGVEPERGVWIAYGYSAKPERVEPPTTDGPEGGA